MDSKKKSFGESKKATVARWGTVLLAGFGGVQTFLSLARDFAPKILKSVTGTFAGEILASVAFEAPALVLFEVYRREIQKKDLQDFKVLINEVRKN